MSANLIRRHPIVTLGIMLFVAVLALVALRLSSGAKSDPRKNRILTVGTMSPIKQDLDVRLTYTADLIPNQLVNIFSRVDGYIAKIYVDKGDLVKANQLLVEIDHTDYVHAVNQAKANLLSAKAKVVQQEAAVRNAALTLDRMQALIKDQFVSQQDLDTALVNRDAALALQDSLRAQVQQMDVALAQAVTNLAYASIRAPFAGYIAERNLDPGAYVSGTTASTSTMSRGILSVHDVETVRTLIEVVEKDVPLVKVGQRADVRAEAYPNEVFEGTVTRIVQALNRATRTMTVEVDLPNKDHRLKGGMFARVEVLVGKHPQAIQIPLDAVSRLEESQYVYVVKDGKAHQVPVELGARAENRVEVVKGLAGDEQVIVSGKDLVSEGAAVQTQPMDTVKRES
ncbi:MAG: efflux RND transporter periplasmic adaptor subunit [Nitrospira sp.]|uniref:efflux RND transporter periplasmic adaptor subunit n=1 Tax=Nitrospira sp. ND1 TaxID=1658518 RepID=UPI0009BC60AE|nr:efflux RND transporter periplasmic adaptor subunit [Nitrospira sp. ND1]MBK7485531.1 efflux RND transporter periplasmic adaptor subunit [Nitrospira sp.]OYT23498.1 MAG: efflux RND transporter periplasmic adaptor subunit [Nitrospira sp. UW-LDO-02]MBK9111880.1 efflux RND transporter periplasmic adaptor subunit [Nitrospira sp.]MBP6207709.1 efflux RND transporter periplasmic adaptor subunit [Nitrospira sp.]MBP7361485.1 efflux RND transporter periplasmic adaptor subunit [Nitrospira sp.]